MRGIFSLAAIMVACCNAVASASGAPIVGAEIETAIKRLDDRVEIQTIAKMRDIVDRDVILVTLRREARRVLAMTAPDGTTPTLAPFEG